MEMTYSRRAFIAGASALAMWPADGWSGQKKSGGKISSPVMPIWEHPDGTATDCVMVRRLYLDLAGRIPAKEEAKAAKRAAKEAQKAGNEIPVEEAPEEEIPESVEEQTQEEVSENV